MAGLLAALLVLVGGSAPPAPARLTEVRVPAGLGDFVQVVGDRLYVAAAGPLGIGDRTLAGYALPDGRALWRASIRVRGPIRQVVELSGVVLLDVENGPRGHTVVAVAAGTGRPVWQREAALSAISPNRAIAVLVSLAGGQPATGGDGGAGAGGGTVTEGVEIRTGRTVWSYRVPNGYWQCVDCEGDAARPGRSVVIRPDGGVEIRDLDTGRLTASAVLLAPGEVRAPLIAARLLLVGGRGGGELTAFSLVTLRPAWRLRLPGNGDWYLGPGCGEYLCLFGSDGGVGLVHPAEGRIRWLTTDWVGVQPVADWLVVSSRAGLNTPSRTAVLDPATGRELRDLGRWTLIGPAGGGRMALLRRDVSTGRAWFGISAPREATVRTLGSVLDVSGDCQSGAGWLLCRRLDASIGIWRYTA